MVIEHCGLGKLSVLGEVMANIFAQTENCKVNDFLLE